MVEYHREGRPGLVDLHLEEHYILTLVLLRLAGPKILRTHSIQIHNRERLTTLSSLELRQYLRTPGPPALEQIGRHGMSATGS